MQMQSVTALKSNQQEGNARDIAIVTKPQGLRALVDALRQSTPEKRL